VVTGNKGEKSVLAWSLQVAAGADSLRSTSREVICEG
jgi:hypothetical protein